MLIFLAFVVGVLASPVIWPFCKKVYKFLAEEL